MSLEDIYPFKIPGNIYIRKAEISPPVSLLISSFLERFVWPYPSQLFQLSIRFINSHLLKWLTPVIFPSAEI